MKKPIFQVHPSELYPLENGVMFSIHNLFYDEIPNSLEMISPSLDKYIEHSNKGYYTDSLRTAINNDNSITYYQIAKPVSVPTIKKIMKCLNDINIKNTVIIVYDYSKNCKANVSKFNVDFKTSYKLQKMIDLIDTDKVSITISKGRYNSQFDNENISLMIRVPKKGYPNLGINHTPTQEDIYKILNSKIEPKIVKSENNDNKELLESFIKAFYKFTMIMNGGKNITNKRWNDTLEAMDVLKNIDKTFPNGEGLQEIVKGVN